MTISAASSLPAHGLPISAVERETGIPKDLLRMWERRYGFPLPGRDEHGDRVYPREQIDKLRLLRRLMDLGFRPGKIVHMETDELDALFARQPARSAPLPAPGSRSSARASAPVARSAMTRSVPLAWPRPLPMAPMPSWLVARSAWPPIRRPRRGPSSRKSRRRWLRAEIPLRRLQARTPSRPVRDGVSASVQQAVVPESPQNLP